MSQLRVFAMCVSSLALINSCQSYTSGLQRSVVRANETAAIALLRTISIAERTYSLSNDGEYATLKQLVDSGNLDARYGGEKPLRDYVITLKVTPKAPGAAEGSYTCNMDPDKTGEIVGRHLYIDSTTSSIHINDSQPATATDKFID
ncbi:MAG TPA: hypothetical protein VIX17_09035 [Pyrinomonadaceae bacterium]